jgi:hypothetical protein
MTMLVSANALAVIELFALNLYSFKSTAIFRERTKRGSASCFGIRLARSLAARDKVQHFPGLGLGQRTNLVVNVFGRGHGN